jgi:hypothetical protein
MPETTGGAPVPQPWQPGAPDLIHRIGERTVWRLYEMCKAVNVAGANLTRAEREATAPTLFDVLAAVGRP